METELRLCQETHNSKSVSYKPEFSHYSGGETRMPLCGRDNIREQNNRNEQKTKQKFPRKIMNTNKITTNEYTFRLRPNQEIQKLWQYVDHNEDVNHSLRANRSYISRKEKNIKAIADRSSSRSEKIRNRVRKCWKQRSVKKKIAVLTDLRRNQWEPGQLSEKKELQQGKEWRSRPTPGKRKKFISERSWVVAAYM